MIAPASRSSRVLKILLVVCVIAVVGPVVAGVVARILVVEAFKIPSGAMSPTLVPGDHVFVSKWRYGLGGHAPQPGEIAVFRYPRDRNKDFIKRIVGVAGDVIEVRGGMLIRNGVPAPRCEIGETEFEGKPMLLRLEKLGQYVHLAMFEREPVGQDGTWRVERGEVFAMGDNRDNSFDSRFWGGIPVDDLKGRALSIWWSDEPGRAGTDLHAPPTLTGPLAGRLHECLTELAR